MHKIHATFHSTPQETKEKEANELSLENVGGVFLVLIMGLLIACLIAICERCYHKKERPGMSREVSADYTKVFYFDFERYSFLIQSITARQHIDIHI